jgi:UDP-N-acetylmuramoylalanine--D-glutamate ligase
MELSGKIVVVYGMGKSGLAAAALLRAHGARVRAIDNQPKAAVEPPTEAAFADADLVVLSPGVPADLPLVEQTRRSGRPVIGEVELAGYFLQGPIIGITGSNGKTTTTALTGHILQSAGIDCQVGGNIGTPPTAMVETSGQNRWNVLELSSFQLETINTFHADVAVCLNVTDNHLDRHHTFENYAAAKARLFETQHSDGVAVLNADDRVCVSFAKKTRATVQWFSMANCQDGRIQLEGHALIATNEIPLRGRHNIENVMAASLAARHTGASLEAIAAGIRTFKAVEHRIEFVRNLNGVDYYNDSKATSVDAALKAIDAFDGGLWIILGGLDKNSDYTVMREPLRSKARGGLLIGSAADKIGGQLDGAVPLTQAGNMENAVSIAHREAKPGDTVLLAPACASYDQFPNYEYRGRAFKNLVNALGEERK